MVIVIVVLSCGAVICAIGVVKKTRDYLHVQRLSNRDEDRTKDSSEEAVELANATYGTGGMRNSEREQSHYQSQSQCRANDPSAPPDSPMERIPFIPPVTPRNVNSSENHHVDQNHPPDSLTILPPSYSEAMNN